MVDMDRPNTRKFRHAFVMRGQPEFVLALCGGCRNRLRPPRSSTSNPTAISGCATMTSPHNR